MRRVLYPARRPIPRLIPVDASGGYARRARARATICLASAAILLMVELAWAVAAHAQANITLGNAGATGALATNTSWSIAKNGGFASGTASWTVGVTKVSVSDQIIQVDGQFVISNTGTGPAAFGNIIVNLQRPCGTVWVSAAADITDSTVGQAATFGNFAAKASFENATRNSPSSSCAGPGNYVVTALPGQTLREGTFFTTAASGKLDLIKASNDSVFSMVPQFRLAAGASIRLFYTATFDNTILGIAPGTRLRPELIATVSLAVPFGFQTVRNIDDEGDDGPIAQPADGFDTMDWAQSIGVRHSFLPTLAQCNQTVTLTDAQTTGNPALTGTATLTTFTSFNAGGTLSIDGSSMSDGQTNTQDVSAAVDGGASGGSVTNCAGITGTNATIMLVVGNFSRVFSVCTGVDDTACDQQNVPSSAGPASPTPTPVETPTPVVTPTPEVTPTPVVTPTPLVTPTPVVTPTPTPTPTPVVPPFVKGEFCTYSEAHWSHTCGDEASGGHGHGGQSLKHAVDDDCRGEGNQAHNVLTDNFDAEYGAIGGVHVGLPCASNRFEMIFASPAAIQNYLPAGGKAGVLDACLVDPSSSHSGNLGGEILALELNVDFSAAGVTEGPGGPFGNLNLCGSGTSLDGMSISEILAAGNKALGKGGMPTGFNPNSLRNLLHQLNDSFDDCHPHGFAQQHLTGAACP